MIFVDKAYPGNYKKYQDIDGCTSQLEYVIEFNKTCFYIPDENNELKLILDLYTTNSIIIKSVYSSLVKLIRKDNLLELMNRKQELDIEYENEEFDN